MEKIHKDLNNSEIVFEYLKNKANQVYGVSFND